MASGFLGEKIAGLDIGKGVSRFGGESVYLDVLRSFARNTKLLLASMESVGTERLGEYAVAVHGIKGSARGVLAEALGDEAEALELAAKSGDLSFIEANNQRFVNTASKLITDIEDALARHGLNVKESKASPDEALLRKLHNACLTMDIDEMDSAMSKLEDFEYTSDDGLVAWLRGKLDQGKYKDIKEMLAGQI